MKKVSILIPTHKGREKFVKIILDKLKNQTFKDFLVIISDNDFEKKNIPEFIKEYSFPIEYNINHTNLGPQQNINNLILSVKTKYFKFILSDDLISDDYLEKTINILEKDSSIKSLFTKRIFIDENDKYLEDANFYEYNKNSCFKASELFAISAKKIDWFAGELTNFIFRFDTNKDYNNLFKVPIENSFKCSYDLILFLNLFDKNDKIYYLSEPLCMIRNHDDRCLLEYDSRILCRIDYFYFILECYKKGYLSKDILIQKGYQLLNEIFYFLEYYSKISLETLLYLKNLINIMINNLIIKCEYNEPFHSIKYIMNLKVNISIFSKLDKKIIIYGAGEYSRQFFSDKDWLDKIEFFVDDSLAGKKFINKEIKEVKLYKDKLYFISTFNYKKEMYNNLIKLGVKPNNIFYI